MGDIVIWTGGLVGAYLLGAIPCGLLVGKARGIDIRTVGSGNIGATNVMRSVGKPWGILTFALDFLKGLLPVVLVPVLAARGGGGPPPDWLGLAAGGAAIVGHSFPVYLRFKGGKGVATSAGVVLALHPPAAGIGVAAWVVLFFTLRYVSLASMLAAASVAAVAWLLPRDPRPALAIVFTLLAALIVLRHRSNIRRLLRGEESRFGRKQAS